MQRKDEANDSKKEREVELNKKEVGDKQQLEAGDSYCSQLEETVEHFNIAVRDLKSQNIRLKEALKNSQAQVAQLDKELCHIKRSKECREALSTEQPSRDVELIRLQATVEQQKKLIEYMQSKDSKSKTKKHFF